MFWLGLLSLWLSPVASVLFTREPRLETVDGNLLIVAADDRNVELATSGDGAVTVNGQNILEIVKAARDAAVTAQGRDTSLVTLQMELRRFAADQNQIKQRLEACEAQLLNPLGTSSTKLSGVNIEVLARRLTTLEGNLRKNNCARVPCRHGGTCLDLYMKFMCLCPDGWEGERCQKDTNECATLAGTDLGCQNGATCVNKPGTYECQCRSGFYGRHCTRKTNDCSGGSSADLCDHGTCVSLDGGGYKCICDQGWSKGLGEQASCSLDVDECVFAPCSRVPKVNCINIPGSFRCESCPAGYSGNGHVCDDVNECAVSNGGCSVVPLVACINTPGSSRCGPCPPGYLGDGITCNYVGRCRANNGGCHPLATCEEIGTNVVCTCLPGYMGPGIGQNGCVLSALAPTNNHPCSPNPCINGRCVLTSAFNYTCDCYIGYSGSLCEISRNPCSSSPCANGGTCIPRGETFRCRCTKFFTGNLCSTERMDCGGFLGSDDGVLEFPSNKLVQYRPNLSCAWRIRVNTSLVINATFDSFDLQPAGGDECTADWLQIYDGKDVGNHNMIGKFCGNQPPLNGTVISTSNNLLLWFKSDRSSNHMGFKLHWNATAPVCGGNLNARVHGTFSSPGSPGKYPINRDCYWTVSTNLGQRITFTFFQLNIEVHSDCNYDYIEFFDGGNTNSPLIARYCTSSNPPPIVIPGNVAYVHFHSDAISSDRGFQISYNPTPGVPGCGGLFTDRRGEIRSLSVDGRYRENLDCVWLVRSHSGQRIKLVFQSLRLEHSTGCMHDFLEVRHGLDQNAPLAGKFCGEDAPLPIISQGSDFYIRFRSDSTLSFEGFVLKYEEICGGTFSAPSGQISSPMYPAKYPDSVDCVYLIDQQPGKAIVLNFLDFQLESSNTRSCFLDYVEIHDGVDEKAPLLGRFCGTTRPGTVFATHNKLALLFHTDLSVSHNGWIANYSTIDTSCGGIHTSLSGSIASPSHPQGYPPNTVCKWVIQVPSGYVIQITFNSFHLEEDNYNSCKFDYLAIYDNINRADDSDTPVAKFCGPRIPPPVTTTNNLVLLRFSTDSSTSGDGFQLNYVSLNTSKVCGGNFFSESGELKSPNFPKSYPSNKLCKWVIQVAPGRQIKLKTTGFRMEDSDKCSYDYLEIRNGRSETSPLIGRYCGGRGPPTITSFSNVLLLVMKTDALRSGPGFRFIWDGSLSGCGGLLTGAMGSITSPNYPEPYGQNAQCLYRIRTAMGSRITLLFVDIQLEESDGCIDDYLEVFDGADAKARSFGRRCTISRDMTSIESTSNQLFIKFHSDMAVSGKGFHISYITKCTLTITGMRGVIESPNYPSTFLPSTSCIWTIVPELGHTINLTFTDFSVPDSNCKESFIEVNEGDRRRTPSNLLGKFCNSVRPPSLISSVLDTVTITLAGASITGVFRIEWAAVGCGGLMTKPQGTFTSPKYPDHYPSLTRCVWTIQVDPDQSVRLSIQNINIENSQNCRMDALEVYGGPNEDSPLLTKLCATQQDEVILESSSYLMTVIFRTDEVQGGRGFTASYRSVPSKCGGLQKTISGHIHSRNYPDNYDINDDCIWTIRVDTLHRVNFTFLNFDLPSSTNCTKTFVEVFDGETLEAPSLLKVCGNAIPAVRTILSSTNVLTVRMKSGSPYTSKGFIAAYSMVCGALITVNEPGTITLNDAITTHPDFENCTWTLVAPQSDGHITASVTTVNMLESLFKEDPCLSSKLEVFDGDTSNATSLGSLCGFSSTLPFTSTGNVLFLKYDSSWSLHQHLQIAYSAVSSACGGELSSLSGMFATPGYPASYPANVECVWTLRSAPGNQMTLFWKEFTLISNEFCNVDYVEIRRGGSTGQLLGTYCNEAPTNLTSDAGFWVKFASGTKTVNPAAPIRFLAEFALVSMNEFSGASGQIASPRYPQPFIGSPGNNAIMWRITTSVGKRIRFTFAELQVDPRCYPKLSIFDGYDDTAIEKVFCGLLPPEPFISSSNVAFIKLTGRVVYMGVKFLINWQEIARSNAAIIKNTTTDCGGDFFLNIANQSIVIRSPNYPNSYPRSKRCEWTVRAPPGFHLGYRITTVNLNPSRNCVFDYILTFDADVEKGRYCLRNDTMTSDQVVEVSRVLKIVLQTSFLPGKSGFEIVVDLDHGGVMEMSEGMIDFHWNGSQWRPWIKAKPSHEWLVHVNKGRRIKVTFETFDIAAAVHGSCKEKYLMLRNGHHEDSPLLGMGKYCGTKPSNIPLTTSEYLFVKINTPWRTSSFRMRFEEVSYLCGGRVILTENVNSWTISTPNYPNSPHPKIQCVWIIQAPAGKTMQIDFIDRFDLKSDDECAGEYVELRDGGSLLAAELGRYCKDPPSTIVTSDNLLFVKYFTNVTDPNNGFRAQVSLEKCGGVIRASQGIVRSPGYPSLQPNVDCSWTIQTGIYQQLVLTFTDFDLPASSSQSSPFAIKNLREWRRMYYMHMISNCSISNTVFIYEPTRPIPPLPTSVPTERPVSVNLFGSYVESEEILGVFCSRALPVTVNSAGNTVHIRLRTGSIDYGSFRGFKLNFNSLDTECGGSLGTPDGIISTPHYPREIPRPYFCQWSVRVPPGRRITAKFLDFDLAGSHMEQRLYLFENIKETEPLAVLSRANPPQSEYKTSGNVLNIAFHAVSFSGSAHRGFRLRYSSDEASVCGGYITSMEGVIEPPRNISTFYCEWVFPDRYHTNGSLVFNLEDVNLGGSKSITCGIYTSTGLFLSVDNDVSKFRVQFCGRVPNQVLASPYGNIKVTSYGTVWSGTVSFLLKYRWSNCGSVITAGMLPYKLTSPGSPASYPPNTDCAWRVDTESGQTIKVIFEAFELEESCRDYLSIYNGGGPSAPMIESYCGRSIPATAIVSQESSLFFHFHSDGQKEGKGFRISLENNHTACGGVIFDEGFELKTPGFPQKYQPNVECEWEIRTLPGTHISLNFTDRFYIEESDKCVNDFLKIFDLRAGRWELINTFCGRSIPAIVYSTSPSMRVLFRSNDALEGDGFSARWSRKCGGSLDGTYGRVVSPGYPNAYPPDSHCEYFIVGHGQLITLNFTTFQLEAPVLDCKFDYVEVEEITPTPVSRGRFCGSELPKPISSHYDLKVTFHSDGFSNFPGFILEYSVESCGGFINESGIIQYTLQRMSKAGDCTWDIVAPNDMIVAVIIANLSLPTNEKCQYVKLKLIDPEIKGNQSETTLCGNPNTVLPFTSTGNKMKLVLNKKYTTYGTNYFFTAYVTFTYGEKEGCGGKLVVRDNPETISSPDVDRNGRYEEFLECQWQIHAEEGYYLTAKILTLDLDSCNATQCICDFLELRDGFGLYSDLILKACGTKPPEVVVSSSNVLWMRFSTDGSYSGRGFTIQFSSKMSPCGPRRLTATEDVQKLVFAKAPNQDPAGIRCSWYITPQHSNNTTQWLLNQPPNILIHIKSWNFDDSVDCISDHLAVEDFGYRDFKTFRDIGSGGVIYHGRPSSIQLLFHAQIRLVGQSRYCGQGKGMDFYASSGEALIETVIDSNSAISDKGFEIEYSLPPCSRNYTRNQGRIRINRMSPGKECVMYVDAPFPNNTISLYFTTFIMPADCVKSYLMINETVEGRSITLLTACGYSKPSPVFSSGSQLKLIFSTAVAGFVSVDITYTTNDQSKGCGGEIFNYGGSLTSPEFPNNVRQNQVCRWNVSVPEGLNIVFKFLVFDLGPATTCGTDFIEFLDIDPATGETIPHARYCGDDEAADIVGTTGNMLIRYTKSVHNAGRGWSLGFAGITSDSQLYD